jgi:ABC-type maltose transport system permease subunit
MTFSIVRLAFDGSLKSRLTEFLFFSKEWFVSAFLDVLDKPYQSKEIEEAAFLDGAGDLKTFTHITLPLALPSIAISALIAFLMAYSEFALGWLFGDKADNVTLAIIMSIPVVIVFLILQKTLVERMMFGSVND